MSPYVRHKPVLEKEVIRLLSPHAGERLLDATIGLGGHASSFLKLLGSKGELVALDADGENLELARTHLSAYSSQCVFHRANFRELPSIRLGMFDIIFADLGMSSPHFDDPSRGFSFRNDGPLDMRLNRTVGETASEMIMRISEEELASLFFEYGEIRQSRKLASAVKKAAPKTTQELKTVCEELYGFRTPSVLPQIFQSLRIAVNDEMGALAILLEIAPMLLKPSGRLGVIAFHSLEDRMVKSHFRALCTPPINERTGAPVSDAEFTLLTRKAVRPAAHEIAENPRARSAKFRAIRRNASAVLHS